MIDLGVYEIANFEFIIKNAPKFGYYDKMKENIPKKFDTQLLEFVFLKNPNPKK
jgi:hypothetical protein